jgi:hypothetical protein
MAEHAIYITSEDPNPWTDKVVPSWRPVGLAQWFERGRHTSNQPLRPMYSGSQFGRFAYSRFLVCGCKIEASGDSPHAVREAEGEDTHAW